MSRDLDAPEIGAYRSAVIRKIKMRVLPFLVVLYIMRSSTAPTSAMPPWR